MPTGRYTNHPKFCTCNICQKAFARGENPAKALKRQRDLEEVRKKLSRDREMKNVFDVLNSPPSEEED